MTQTASCPKCGSQDARSLSVVHESGLSSVQTQTRGAGCNPLAILLFPIIGFWSLLFSSFGKARTTGTVQSAASAKAGPPVRKPLAFSLFLAVVGLFLLSGHTVLGVLLIAVGVLSFYAAWTYNRRVHPYQYQVWEQSAMCQRCGTVFVADAARITLEAVTTGQLLADQQRKLVGAAQPVLNRAQNFGEQMTQKAMQKSEALDAAAQRKVDGAFVESAVVESQVKPETPGKEN